MFLQASFDVGWLDFSYLTHTIFEPFVELVVPLLQVTGDQGSEQGGGRISLRGLRLEKFNIGHHLVRHGVVSNFHLLEIFLSLGAAYFSWLSLNGGRLDLNYFLWLDSLWFDFVIRFERLFHDR